MALRITASGAYYWRFLVRSFAYLDLVWVDTPINVKELAKNLAELADATDLRVRFRRVRMFLDFLKRQEEQECRDAVRRSGPYKTTMMPQIIGQVEKEIEEISTKKRIAGG